MTRRSRLKATVHRRNRLAVSLLARPADGWLAVRMAAWRVVLPLLKRRLPLRRLIRLMWVEGPSRPAGSERQARIAELARIVYRSEHSSRSGNCLERSLVLFRYLSAAGADPELLIGMRRGEDAVRGHAWITVGGTAAEEEPESLDALVRVVAFRGDGSQLRSTPVSGPLGAAR
jgi:hypothetical protein